MGGLLACHAIWTRPNTFGMVSITNIFYDFLFIKKSYNTTVITFFLARINRDGVRARRFGGQLKSTLTTGSIF